MAFRGNFEHSLDAKHRLTIPARFREAFAGGVVLAKAPEAKLGTPRSLAIWPVEDFNAYASAALAGLNPISSEAREMKRIINGNAHDTELDSAYRVMVPPDMLRFAGLDKEVALVGSGEYLEIFDRKLYAAYNEDVLSRFTEIAAAIDHTA